jgi:hypothetical protein
MVFCDLGAGEYTKDYFSDKRYTIFCNSSESHNTPIINNHSQGAGKEFRAKDFRILDDGKMQFDMAESYRIPEVLQVERCFDFNIHTGSLAIKDAFTLSPDFSPNPFPVKERFVTLIMPIVEYNAVYVDIHSGHSLKRCCLRGPQGISPVIGEVEHRNHAGNLITVYTIDFPLLFKDIVSFAEFYIIEEYI